MNFKVLLFGVGASDAIRVVNKDGNNDQKKCVLIGFRKDGLSAIKIENCLYFTTVLDLHRYVKYNNDGTLILELDNERLADEESKGNVTQAISLSENDWQREFLDTMIQFLKRKKIDVDSNLRLQFSRAKAKSIRAKERSSQKRTFN